MTFTLFIFYFKILGDFRGKNNFPRSAKKGSSIGEKMNWFFITLSGKQGVGGSNPSVKNLTLFFFNEGFPKVVVVLGAVWC